MKHFTLKEKNNATYMDVFLEEVLQASSGVDKFLSNGGHVNILPETVLFVNKSYS